MKASSFRFRKFCTSKVGVSGVTPCTEYGCGFDRCEKINRKVRLGTRCLAVGRSGEVPLLEVLNNSSIYGRHSVPCVMAVVESLAALLRPAVERFHCTFWCLAMDCYLLEFVFAVTVLAMLHLPRSKCCKRSN